MLGSETTLSQQSLGFLTSVAFWVPFFLSHPFHPLRCLVPQVSHYLPQVFYGSFSFLFLILFLLLLLLSLSLFLSFFRSFFFSLVLSFSCPVFFSCFPLSFPLFFCSCFLLFFCCSCFSAPLKNSFSVGALAGGRKSPLVVWS